MSIGHVKSCEETVNGLYAQDFRDSGIQVIDRFPADKVYCATSKAMETGAWEQAAEDLQPSQTQCSVRALVLSKNFCNHHLASSYSVSTVDKPHQSPPSSIPMEKIVDPLYRRVARRIP